MSDFDETVSRPAEAALLAQEPTFVLTVVSGPDQTARLLVDTASNASILIGKGPACQVRLTDASVSRRHASLMIGEHGLLVRDLDSTNGTWISNTRIVEAWLRLGECLQLGDTTLRLEAGTEKPSTPISSARSFGGLIGASREMRLLYPICEKLARAEIPVLIEGETGTGKEVLAEAIHSASARASKPFVTFDCTSASANLLESDLFGHERGAFTGAISTRAGVFEEANGGTLFIDEIGDLDIGLQAKLLRAVERQEIRRVGGNRWMKVDVRVLSATRRDLDREVQEGRFRDDLFHRLVVGRLELPPLRRRRGDIKLLARHFAEQLGHPQLLSNALLTQWEALPWTGNVRELRNVVARHLALTADESTDSTLVDDRDLFGQLPPATQDRLVGMPLVMAKQRLVEAFETWYIAAILDKSGGSVALASQAAGVAKRYFQLLNARRKKPL